MGRRAKWRSTRKRVAFAPTTTTMTTIEPDGAPVVLPESARAGERRRFKPSPLTFGEGSTCVHSHRFRTGQCSVVRRGFRWSPGCRNASAAGIICDADAAAMRSHDFADDSEAESGAFLFFTRAAPEPLEDVLSIVPRHAAAAIGHFDPAPT